MGNKIISEGRNPFTSKLINVLLGGNLKPEIKDIIQYSELFVPLFNCTSGPTIFGKNKMFLNRIKKWGHVYLHQFLLKLAFLI